MLCCVSVRFSGNTSSPPNKYTIKSTIHHFPLMLVVVMPTHWTVASVKSASLLSLWDIASPNVRKMIFYIFFNQPGSVALSILILLNDFEWLSPFLIT